MKVDPWVVVGVAAAVLAIIATIVIAVIAHRKQFPKRELRYSVEVIPLLHGVYGHPASGLKVALHGRTIENPHVVSIRVWSESRADIASAAFDNGDAISFSSSVEITPTALTAKSDTTIGVEVVGTSAGHWSMTVPAQLIRPGARGAMAGIADGKPKISVTNSLIDIALADDDQGGARSWWRTYGLGARSLLVTFTIALAFSSLVGALLALWK